MTLKGIQMIKNVFIEVSKLKIKLTELFVIAIIKLFFLMQNFILKKIW